MKQILRVILKYQLGWLALALTLVFWLPTIAFPSFQAIAQTDNYCRVPASAIAEKRRLHQAAVAGDREARQRYGEMVQQQANQLQQCRERTWPRRQAIWLRLHPCDARPGGVSAVMDELVNLGYNEVYLETFYSGRVLLPAAENRTPWPSVVNTPGAERVDLLAQAIAKGRERGLKVYAWLFSLNFGRNYLRAAGRDRALARNAWGETTQSVRDDGLNSDPAARNPEQLFVDPYHPTAQADFLQMVQAVAQRQPDGMLFDYIRYHRGLGGQSVTSKVQDLWIYGEASQQVLLSRAQNYKGLAMIQQFLDRGFISPADVTQADKAYPDEPEPLWQGRIRGGMATLSPQERQAILQQELWYLTVAHAAQGVLDFLNLAIQPAQAKGIPVGAVFFPEANYQIGNGFDSRLQPWERFPANIEWHPMSYAICGNPTCIVQQIQRVVNMAPPITAIRPALAGLWGKSLGNRPSLEVQMAAIRQAFPRIDSISHFAYSWQNPANDQARKACLP